MTNYSEQLLELQVQIAEKKHIETKLQNLRTQKESLEYNISKLGQEKVREDEDVEKLEGGSLLGLLLHLTGSYRCGQACERNRRPDWRAFVQSRQLGNLRHLGRRTPQ